MAFLHTVESTAMDNIATETAVVNEPVIEKRRLRRKIRIPRELLFKRLWFVLLLPISLLASNAAQRMPELTEAVYAQGIYPVISTVFGFLASLVPISIGEILLLLLPILLLTYLAYQIVQIFRNKKGRKMIAARLAATLLSLVSVAVFLFTAFCGLNYSRQTFAALNGLAVTPSSVEELEQLCVSLTLQVNTLRETLDENGVMVSGFSTDGEKARFAQTAYGNLGEEYPVLSGYTPRPKPVMLSSGMFSLNITGIYSPFTFEANVNVDVPEYTVPATMMHELSHFKGFMREDEANFIAYLACRESGSNEFYYSGSMLALQHSLNALHGVDPDSYFDVTALLSDAVNRDREANRAYWTQFETPVAETSAKVNDIYLKRNHQDNGIQSYGQMVDLLLADFREDAVF